MRSWRPANPGFDEETGGNQAAAFGVGLGREAAEAIRHVIKTAARTEFDRKQQKVLLEIATGQSIAKPLQQRQQNDL